MALVIQPVDTPLTGNFVCHILLTEYKFIAGENPIIRDQTMEDNDEKKNMYICWLKLYSV